MRPLISIIIPVYNQTEKLAKALDSIEKQSYNNLEVIVVDDGSASGVKPSSRAPFGLSPQDRRQVEGSQKSIEPKVKGRDIVFLKQENKGAPVARNKGFESSKGEYVIFWDADIVGKYDMLEKMFQGLQNDLNTSYAYSNFYFGKKKMLAREFSAEELKKNNYIMTTSLIRREDFPGFDEKLKRFQDWDLWLTMIKAGKNGVWIDEYLFQADTGGTMSNWLPKIAYKKPWRYLPGIKKKVDSYFVAKKIVMEKHRLE